MDDVTFFYNGPEPILRILVVGTLTYFFIVFTLRISGKRTLASMTAFDFIITITIGSAFGRILTARKVALLEALTAVVLLVLLQFIMAWLKSRSKAASRVITSEATLLFHKGEFLRQNLEQERMRENDILAAARKEGIGSLEQVEAVILETDGTFSVIKKATTGDGSAYAPLKED